MKRSGRGVSGRHLAAGMGMSLAVFAPAASAVVMTGPDDGGAPNVRVYSAVSPPAEAAAFLAFDAAFDGGVRVALGDVNGDGVLDRIVGTGPRGASRVRVFSGSDGTQLADFFPFTQNYNAGVHVAAGDVNGDGRDDLVVGTGGTQTNQVRVFDAQAAMQGNPQPVASFFPYGNQSTMQVYVATADFNGDGRADIVTGPGPGNAPLVRVYDVQGGQQATIASFMAFDQAFTGGVTVAAGDTTGDTQPEIVVGAASQGSTVRIYTVSGQSAQQAAAFLPYAQNFNGGVRVAVGDVSGDGRGDVVTGTGPGGGPNVRAFSGVDQSQVASFFAYDPAFSGGIFVAARNLTVQDRIAFSAASYSVNESAAVAGITVTVRRTGSGSGAVSVNFAAQAGTAGTQDFLPASGTLSWADGDTADKTFVVRPVDDSTDEPDETLQLLLSNVSAGAQLDTPSTATLTIVDNDAPPPSTLAFAASAYSTNEAASITVIVSRANGSSGAASVRVRSVAGTATSGTDYQPIDQVLTWADGDTGSRGVSFVPVDDSLDESNETLQLTLSEATGATLGQIATTTITIADNDDAPSQIGFVAAAYSVPESGSLSVTVRRENNFAGAASVRVRSVNGTATGADYGAIDQVLNWGDGDTTDRTVLLQPVNDSTDEPDETLQLVLSEPSGAGIGNIGATTVTIVDNDEPPPVSTLGFALSAYSVSESGETATVTIRRGNGSSGAVSVRVRTVAGTAASGSDFVAVDQVLNWAEGDTSDRTIVLGAIDDAGIESAETFQVVLSEPNNATLGAISAATVTLVDNDTPPAAPSIAFDVASYAATEATGSVAVIVRRQNGGAASVRVRSVAGSASSPADFGAVDQVLSWAQNEADARTVLVPIVDDALFEAAESFTLVLESATGAALGAITTTTVTIAVDEVQATADFVIAETRVSEAAGSVVVTVRRSGETRTRVQTAYRSLSGSGDAAEPGLDYDAVAGTLIWEPGQTERTITVTIREDAVLEAHESFSLLLESPGEGLAVAGTRGRVIIEDNELSPFGSLYFGGSANPWLLGLFGLALLWRHRRRALTLLLAGGALLASQASLASPFYAGVRAGGIASALDSDEVTGELQNAGYAVDVDLDDFEPNWGVYGGWRFMPKLAVELGYQDLGEFTARIEGDLSDARGIARAAARNYVGSGEAVSLALRVDQPLASRLSLRAALGGFAWTSEVALRNDLERAEAEADGFGFLVGLGLGLDLGAGLTLGGGAELLRPGTAGMQQLLYGSLEWRFGE